MMTAMPEPGSDGSGARSAAFALAFGNPRSLLPYEIYADTELLPRIQKVAPAATEAECLEALALVRSLCDTVYEICFAFRAGRFGEGEGAAGHAIDELSRREPGFSRGEYGEAFSVGMLWTAF